MSRIQPLQTDKADATTAATLKAVEAKLRVLPNMFTTMAHAPAVLNGYLQLSESLSRGSLNARQREMIALAVAEANQCEYCLSAHAALGKLAGLNPQDIDLARSGSAVSNVDAAVLRLALHIVDTRGGVSDAELEAARAAGLNDKEILEVVGQVAVNVLTNYVNRLADTETDFPLVKLK